VFLLENMPADISGIDKDNLGKEALRSPNFAYRTGNASILPD
jgi:hypothetical protein